MATKLDTAKIVQVSFPKDQYYQDVHTKKQVVIHHTVSSGNAKNVFSSWTNDSQGRVATPFVIAGDGVIHQGFSSKEWAHHLGTKLSNNTALNQASIGIEVCSWGPLEKGGYTKNGQFIAKDANKFYNAYGGEVPANEVVDYGDKKFKNRRYYHKYGAAQIESLRQMIQYLCETYGIPKTYQSDMWDLSSRATSGEKGVFTHVSYRTDKSDMHPQAELIAMLKNIDGI